MDSLYHNFLMVAQPLTAGHEVFEAISQWVYHLQDAEREERSPDSGVDENTFGKIKTHLRTEIETWELIMQLYSNRLNPSEEEMDPDSLLNTTDMYHINENKALTVTVGRSPDLKEMNLIIRWLEAIYSSRKDPPDLLDRFVNWEQTFETLKKERLLRNPSTGVMVEHIDPDAVTREKKQLHPLDETDAARGNLGAFYYLRIGDFDRAFGLLHDTGNTAAAASNFGTQFTTKEKTDDPTAALMHHIPAINRRVTHRRPDFKIVGNTRRDMWKHIAFMICDTNQQSKYERAALGALCGHREALLQAASTWEDQLWSYLKVSYDVGVEQQIRSWANSVSSREYIPMPQKYWDQSATVEECIKIVDANYPPFKPYFSPEFIFRNVQRTVMMDIPADFLHPYTSDLCHFVEASEESGLVLNHTIRFAVHLLLVYSLFNKNLSQDIIDYFTVLYADILVNTGHLTYLPFYVKKVTEAQQIPLIAHHISAITTATNRVPRDDMHMFLKTAQLNGIDPLKIGIAVIDRLREKEDGFSPENLEWISLSYNYVSDTKEVMLALLQKVLTIARCHFLNERVDKVRRVFNEVRKKCIQEVSMISDVFRRTYIKEFECYTLYLEAETEYFRWLKVLQQEPKLDEKQMEDTGTLSDKAVYDRKVREFHVKRKLWEQNFAKLTSAVFDKFKNVLNFPQGFLINCTAEENGQQDAYEIQSARRYLVGNMVRYLMKLVGVQRNFTLLREFTKLLASKWTRIYQVLSPTELSTIYSWLEQYVRSNSKNFARIPE